MQTYNYNAMPPVSPVRLSDIGTTDLHHLLGHLGLLFEQINRRIPQLLEYYVAPWQLSVLAWSALNSIREAGGEATLSTIGERIDASPSTMTGIATRLEQTGYVRRSSSTTDRRAIVLTCTDRGNEVLDTITEQFYNDLVHVARDVDAKELEAIVTSFTRITNVLETLAAKQATATSRET
ncbi:MAG TPA: MarR family transcriptional regulator [Thermomicrobiales bacterium]|nr:MarR family transcriptional regulator [Thermomicrobiales bacterium]